MARDHHPGVWLIEEMFSLFCHHLSAIAEAATTTTATKTAVKQSVIKFAVKHVPPFYIYVSMRSYQAVMKFAEMSQEVQISKPLPSRLDFGLTPGRRKFNEDAKKSKDMINLGEKRKDLTVGHCFGFVDSGVVYK
jgi:hypothetical protein